MDFDSLIFGDLRRFLIFFGAFCWKIYRFRFQASSCPGECNDLQAATAMALQHAELDGSDSATDYSRFCLQSCSPPTAKQSLCLASLGSRDTSWEEKRGQRATKEIWRSVFFWGGSNSELFDKYAVELEPWASWVKGWSMGNAWVLGARFAWFQRLLAFILTWEGISSYNPFWLRT